MTKNTNAAKAISLIPRDIKDIFGERPLIAGEKVAEYDAIFAKIATAIAPENFVIWLYVRDLVDAVWEVRRYRLWTAAIVNNGQLEALRRLLEPVIAGEVPGFAVEHRTREFIVKRWTGDDKEKEAVRLRMEKYGFDQTSITAEAFVERLQTIEAVERLLFAAERRRERILREIDRYRAAYAQRARHVIDADSIEIIEAVNEHKPKRRKRPRRGTPTAPGAPI